MFYNLRPNDNTICIQSSSQILSTNNGNAFMIVKDDMILMHFDIDKIVTFELFNNSIRIYTGDKLPSVIFFYDNNEAEIANELINNLING